MPNDYKKIEEAIKLSKKDFIKLISFFLISTFSAAIILDYLKVMPIAIISHTINLSWQ